MKFRIGNYIFGDSKTNEKETNSTGRIGDLNSTKYNSLEKDILEQYTTMVMMSGINENEAKEIVSGLLDNSIEEARNEGTYGLPSNLGEYILGDLVNDDEDTQMFINRVRGTLQMKLEDGVRPEDIKWWWNLNDIERRMMEKYDGISMLAIFSLEREKNTASNAGKVVRKLFPIYGDPNDPRNTGGEDRLIPYELKDRINKYIERKRTVDSEEYRKALDEATSFNALIRKEIKLGNI